MKDKLAKALNEVRDEFIDEAAKSKQARRWAWVPAVAAVLAVAILVSSFADIWVLQAQAISQADYDNYEKPDWQASYALADQLQGFMTESMTQILSSDGRKNTAYSPINLYMALAVTAELSGGNDQLLELMDVTDLADLRQQANLVWNACYRDQNDQTLLANSVWLRQGMEYDQTVMDTLADNYFTSSYTAQFGTKAANSAIAAWLNQQTGKMLKDKTAGIDLSADTVFALYSTVFFRAKWSSEFSAINNTKGIFHGVTDASCIFMNKKEMTGTYYWGEDYSAVTVYLKGNSTMWLILPDTDKTVADVIDSGEYLGQVLGSGENLKAMKINLSLPKFDISSSGNLKEDLQTLGVTEIFDRDADCFANFLRGESPVWIDAVNQATRVAIDEEGVTAASYIEMPGAGSAMPPEEIIDFILDRPFIFVITNGYNLPLFAGVVNDLS